MQSRRPELARACFEGSGGAFEHSLSEQLPKYSIRKR